MMHRSKKTPDFRLKTPQMQVVTAKFPPDSCQTTGENLASIDLIALTGIVQLLFSALCMFFVAHHINTQHGGSGQVAIDMLYNALNDVYQFNWTPRHYNRVLARGDGMLWNVNRRNGRLFLVAQTRKHHTSHAKTSVVETMTQLAIDHDPDLIDTDRPGSCLCWIDLGGSHQEAIANVFTAWIHRRNRRKRGKGQPVRLSLLCRLWGKTSKNTIRNWCKRAGVWRRPVFTKEKTDGKARQLPSINRVPKPLQPSFKHRKSYAARAGRAAAQRAVSQAVSNQVLPADVEDKRVCLKLYYAQRSYTTAQKAAMKNANATDSAVDRWHYHAIQHSPTYHSRVQLMERIL